MYQALWDIFVGNLCCYFISYFIAQGPNIGFLKLTLCTGNHQWIRYLSLILWDIYICWDIFGALGCLFGAMGYQSLMLWDIYHWCFGISISGALGYLRYLWCFGISTVSLLLWDIYFWCYEISLVLWEIYLCCCKISLCGAMGYLSWVPYLLLLDIFSWSENQSTRSASVKGQSRRAGSFLRTVRDRVNWLSIRWGVLGAEIQAWKVKSDKQD